MRAKSSPHVLELLIKIVQYQVSFLLNVFLMMMFAVKDVITPENILKQTVHEERHQSACDSIIKPNGDFQNFI